MPQLASVKCCILWLKTRVHIYIWLYLWGADRHQAPHGTEVISQHVTEGCPLTSQAGRGQQDVCSHRQPFAERQATACAVLSSCHPNAFTSTPNMTEGISNYVGGRYRARNVSSAFPLKQQLFHVWKFSITNKKDEGEAGLCSNLLE